MFRSVRLRRSVRRRRTMSWRCLWSLFKAREAFMWQVRIFYAGFDQYDAKLVYTDLYQAQQFYDAGDSVTGVELKVSDIEHQPFRSMGFSTVIVTTLIFLAGLPFVLVD